MSSVRHLLDAPHWVYRAFDADGRLLYVGMTAQPTKRYLSHRAQRNSISRWFGHVDRWRLTGPFVGPDARIRAAALEMALIKTERPLHNGTGLKASRGGGLVRGLDRPDVWGWVEGTA